MGDSFPCLGYSSDIGYFIIDNPSGDFYTPVFGVHIQCCLYSLGYVLLGLSYHICFALFRLYLLDLGYCVYICLDCVVLGLGYYI